MQQVLRRRSNGGGKQVRHGADERSLARRKDSNRWRELTVAGVGPNPPGNIAEGFTKPAIHKILIKGSDVEDSCCGAVSNSYSNEVDGREDVRHKG